MRQQRTWVRPMVATTMAVTAGAVALSWGFNYLLLFADGLSAFSHAAITATVLPVLLVAPLMAFGLWQKEQARRLRKMSGINAARDPASGFVGQTMLSSVVEDRRRNVPATDGPVSGAFLMLEANGLKQINARFGPEWTASALALVADTIRKSVRASDLVGRLETGEFGIFLSNASEKDAEQVGQRIVDTVASIYFAPEGIESVISTRVAGIVFDHQIEFAEMVRHTAHQLAYMSTKDSSTLIQMKTLTDVQPNE